MAQRDWKRSSFLMLIMMLILAVMTVSAIDFLSIRSAKFMHNDAHKWLGGHLLITHDAPLEKLIPATLPPSSKVAYSTVLLSMVRAQKTALLTEVKAISAHYPLLGLLTIKTDQGELKTNSSPKTEEVWASQSSFSRLGLSLGDKVLIGEKSFKITAKLMADPEQGNAISQLAPRILINQDDLLQTQLIQPGSRISYRAHFTGTDQDILDLKNFFKKQQKQHPGLRIRTLDEAQPTAVRMLDEAKRFMKLASLLTLILTITAILMITHHDAQKKQKTWAILRCLGASKKQMLTIYLFEFLLIALIGSLLGTILGYWVQQQVVEYVLPASFGTLPEADITPWIKSISFGTISMLGFIFPHIQALLKISPTQALREVNRLIPLPKSMYAFCLILLVALLAWSTQNVPLALYVLGGLSLCLTAYFSITMALLKALAAFTKNTPHWILRFCTTQLIRTRANTLLLVSSISLSITALLILSITRYQLIDSWFQQVPDNAPNYFMIGITPESKPLIEHFFKKHQVQFDSIQPMIRGRLTHINGNSVGPEQYKSTRAKRLITRNFNLSWSERLPSKNKITQGSWHENSRTSQWSFETGIAETLGIQLNDRVTFMISDELIEGIVSSIRSLEWQSMNVNFFVIANPTLLQNYIPSFITSFHLKPDQGKWIKEITDFAPSASIIDVSSILREVRETISQVSQGAQSLFYFALIAGLFVVFASLKVTWATKVNQLTILKTLGATKQQLRSVLATEFTLIGLLSSVLASLGCLLVTFLLQTQVFNLPASIDIIGDSLFPSLLISLFISATLYFFSWQELQKKKLYRHDE